MDTLIAIDIGNTNMTVGVFRDERLVRKTKLPTQAPAHQARYFRRIAAGLPADVPVIISSVVPLALARLIVSLRKALPDAHLRIAGRHLRVPIRNRYKHTHEVGQDRLVNAYAAKVLYGAPCVVVDFGTAVTFDVVSKDGAYLGGLILPGIGISFRALHERTALLPKVELKPARSIIGRTTVESMRGGILFGFGALFDGLIARYRRRLGPRMKVVVTGGNTALIRRYIGTVDGVDADLTLKGLRLIAARGRYSKGVA